MQNSYTCTRCTLSKSESEFSYWNGRRESRCKKCKAELADERRRANGVPVARYSVVEGETKLCLKCNRMKSFAEFSKCKVGVAGLQSYCKSCSSENIAEYYQENKEELDTANRKWAEENKDKVRIIKDRWLKDNPEKRKVAAIKHFNEKRASLNNSLDDGTITTEFLTALYQTTHCYYCNLFTEYEQRTQDHKTPLTRGGEHTAGNLVMACMGCNTRKFTMTEAEFRLKLADG